MALIYLISSELKGDYMGSLRSIINNADGSNVNDRLIDSKERFVNVPEPVSDFDKEVVDYMQGYNLAEDASNNDILVYIMLYLCQRVNPEFSAYKGGFVLTCLLPEEARRTEDVDFSISDAGQYEHLKVILHELGNLLVSKGLFISYEIKETITETMSGGIKFVKKDGSKNIGIDIGLHTLSYGVTKWEYKGLPCNRFEVERMLSDKISAIYSRKRFRRTKDLYDFYIITCNFDVDLVKLNKYIELRGIIEWDKDPFSQEVLEQYAIAYDKLSVMSVRDIVIHKPKFDEVITQLNIFMRGLQRGDTVWRHKDSRTSKDF